jgi:hypothetical protein
MTLRTGENCCPFGSEVCSGLIGSFRPRPLPVFPDKQTFLESGGMLKRAYFGSERTHSIASQARAGSEGRNGEASGPLLILTSHESLHDPKLLEELKHKGIGKVRRL